jgi:UDP-N-acetyl-D-mannosaminuronate dehydrogenase
MKIGILGFGEIGKAIYQIYQNKSDYDLYVKDLNRDDGLVNIDVLNVSIPQVDENKFVDIVSENIKTSNAKIVIIHSTISVGVTSKIKEANSNTIIAHSPCRGVHPNLYEGLLTFEKLIGSPDKSDALKIERHLSQLGIKTYVCVNSETSELAKLLDTSYYGLCIAYHGEAQKACEKFGASFEEAMTFYNKTYNNGYAILNKSNVIRPVLTPPQEGIGGHCVIQNAELLSKQFNSTALEFILSYKMNK